jgi:hypothetical protein
MHQKVSLYVRQRGTRKIAPANPKAKYELGTIYLIRYRRHGKRAGETLANCPTYAEAKAAAMRKGIDLLTGDAASQAQWQKQYRNRQPTGG